MNYRGWVSFGLVLMVLGLSGCDWFSDSNPKSVCPYATKECGNGCIPKTGVCCDNGLKLTSSYCTNNAGGGCRPNTMGCPAAFPFNTNAEFCCSNTGTIGSNDCPTGQHHCGLLCYPLSTECKETVFSMPEDTTEYDSTGDVYVQHDGNAGEENNALDGGDTVSVNIDPCDVVGNWLTTWDGGYQGCDCFVTADKEAFTITPEVAAFGGTWEGSYGPYTFDPSTCTLTTSFETSNPCFTGTRTYSREIKNGEGTFQATYVCFSGATCLCSGTRTAWDKRQ